MISKELQKRYREMTPAQAKAEVRLLKEEFKKHYKETVKIEQCLEYLDYKLKK